MGGIGNAGKPREDAKDSRAGTGVALVVLEAAAYAGGTERTATKCDNARAMAESLRAHTPKPRQE
jgi:hypothetical protein